jgi:bifunctional non-homologous end joining protein LigD
MAHDDNGRVPAWIPPMLATSDNGQLPDNPRYSYEFKWDGYRAAMRISPDGTTRLTSRNNNDFTARFPQLAGALGDTLGGRAGVLDGEIVALNELGQPDFGLLQNRATVAPPVSYFVFDVLQLGDVQLLDEPYDHRREVLEQLTPPDKNLVAITPAYSHADLSAIGLAPHGLLTVAADSGLEGLVIKAKTSKYHPGRRSPDWRKHPLIHTREVILCGWRPGQGRIIGTFGGLLLGAYDPDTGDLVYIGDVGTGFTDRARQELQVLLDEREQPHSPFAQQIPRADALRAHWAKPDLVGEVVYRQFTRGEGRLRHTAWRGLRPDRDSREILAPEQPQ